MLNLPQLTTPLVVELSQRTHRRRMALRRDDGL